MRIQTNVRTTKEEDFKMARLAEEFNRLYITAATTSNTSLYFEAAMMARQLVDHLEVINLVDPLVFHKLKREITT